MDGNDRSSITHRLRRVNWPIMLIGFAFVLVPTGVVLSSVAANGYLPGNLVIGGGLCLIVGIGTHQLLEKGRRR